jgi:hypothetical protein
MKKILAILSVTGIVFFISGSVSAQTFIKPPIRTADLHPAVQRAIPVALPMKSGGGAKTITSAQPGAVKGILPPIRSGSTTGPGGNKAIPAGHPGGQQTGSGSGATGGAGSTKLPIKGTGTGGTGKQ